MVNLILAPAPEIYLTYFGKPTEEKTNILVANEWGGKHFYPDYTWRRSPETVTIKKNEINSPNKS